MQQPNCMNIVGILAPTTDDRSSVLSEKHSYSGAHRAMCSGAQLGRHLFHEQWDVSEVAELDLMNGGLLCARH